MDEINFDVLFDGDYVDVVDPNGDGYEALHEPDVAIAIPILVEDDQIVVRKEEVPPYGIKNPDGNDEYHTVISGKIEEGEDPETTMLRELKEEAGILNPEYKIPAEISHVPVCKSTDLRANIFVLEISDYDQVEPQGDGTVHEERSQTLFLDAKEFTNVMEDEPSDLFIYVVYWLINDIYM